jgi:hypothetical protein
VRFAAFVDAAAFVAIVFFVALVDSAGAFTVVALVARFAARSTTTGAVAFVARFVAVFVVVVFAGIGPPSGPVSGSGGSLARRGRWVGDARLLGVPVTPPPLAASPRSTSSELPDERHEK